ncbi:MAG: hypothetical protein ACXWNQ_05250 [Anaerolineales bacterium]
MTPSHGTRLQQYAPFLEALDGIVYVTNFDGDFLACGTRHWKEFATNNGAPHLTGPIALNTLRSCSDSETAQAYAIIYDAFRTGKLDSYHFGLRCDTPSLKRELRMSLTILVLDGQRAGIIHHCFILAETERPFVRLLENPLAAEAGKSMIRMCSYCLRIKQELVDVWIEPEAYYRAGGGSDVSISHGICPDCHNRVVAPVLRLN